MVTALKIEGKGGEAEMPLLKPTQELGLNRSYSTEI